MKETEVICMKFIIIDANGSFGFIDYRENNKSSLKQFGVFETKDGELEKCIEVSDDLGELKQKYKNAIVVPAINGCGHSN